MIEFQSKSLPNEVMDYFGHSLTAPSLSAYIQQRQKIFSEGWDFLFHSFVHECSSIQNHTYRGYHLLACDGSDVNISRDPSDSETFIHEGEKGYNIIRINALYDLLNHTYCDFAIQGKKKLHERQAFNTIVDRYNSITSTIFIADRGYESFNVFAHLIGKGQKFIIRIKDISSNGILSNHNLPDSEFDTYIETTLTRRHTKETQNNPDIYTSLPPGTDFDFLDESDRYYKNHFRIIRFQAADGNYTCVAANFSKDEFCLNEMKELYLL